MNFSTRPGRIAKRSGDELRFFGKRYRQLVAGFNVYRVSPIAAESVPAPTIHTAYRGVPLACSAGVVSVDQREVTFAINSLQAKAVARMGSAVVMSPLHGLSFEATAKGVDTDRGRASFCRFVTRHRGGTEKRTNLRVEPENPIEVRLKGLDGERTGQLLDISVVSLAVKVAESELDGFAEGELVKVTIPALGPDDDLSVDAEGRIIRTQPLEDGSDPLYDVVVYLNIDPKLYDRLERYVDVRRIGLIRELSESEPQFLEAEAK